MPCFCPIHALLTHVIAQLTYHHIPLPEFVCDHRETVDYQNWQRMDYIDFMKGEIQPGGFRHPWAAALQSWLDGNIHLVVDSLLRHIQMASHEGCRIIVAGEPDFPAEILHLVDPPAALTINGDVSLLKRTKIGVVGARKASEFSYRETMRLAAGLVKKGFVVVSGGALGCDQAAHKGALMGAVDPAATVVVLASGLQHLYPRANAGIFEAIRRRRGLIVSERLFWMPPRPHDFPVRNRIIAGLSQVMMVMQASARSGAMITASHALELGRDVFVLRQKENDVRMGGTIRLLEEGAYGFIDSGSLLRQLEDPGGVTMSEL